MAQDDDVSYWEEYYENLNDITFSGYDVTTTNPNYSLLVVTMTFVIACFFFGVLVFPGSPFHATFKATVAHLHSKIGQNKTGHSLKDHLRPSTSMSKPVEPRNTEINDTEYLGNTSREQSIIVVESTNLPQLTVSYSNTQNGNNNEDDFVKDDTSKSTLNAHKFKGKPKQRLLDRVRSKLKTKKSRINGQKVELKSAGDINISMENSSKVSIELPPPSTPYLNTQTRLKLSSPQNSLFDTNAKKVGIKVTQRKGQRGKMRFGGNQNSMRELVAISVKRNQKRREHVAQERTRVPSPAANAHCILETDEGHILSDKRSDTSASNGKLDFEDLTSYLRHMGHPQKSERSDSASDLSSLSNNLLDDDTTNSGSAYSGKNGNLWSEMNSIFHLGAP